MGSFWQIPSSGSTPPVASADSTANSNIADVIGNKTDTAQTTVGTTRSLMGYLKGVLTTVLTLMVAPTTVETSTFSVDPMAGAYTQLIASTGSAIKAITVSGNFYNIAADATITLEVATGAGGAEVVCATHRSRWTTAITAGSYYLSVRLNKAASTRIAVKGTQSSGSAALYGGYTVEEA